MGYKKRPKNKQELSPKSGVKKKPVMRDRVLFEFESEGNKYRNGGEGRIKLCKDGFLTFVVKNEGKWKNVKGELKKLRLIKERKPVGYLKKNV